MTLPSLPPAPANPTVQPSTVQAPLPVAPTYVQSPASALSGTQAQTNNNNALNTTNIRNSATYINEIRGSRVQVGDISYDVPSLGITAGFNQYGDYNGQVQISIPLGGSNVRRSATAIAKYRAQAALGSLCKSIQQANFDVEIVTSLYPDMPQLKSCAAKAVKQVKDSEVNSETVSLKVSKQEAELAQLRAEVELMRAKFKHSKETNAVRGLW
jgi:hypothetical protein